MGVYFYNPKPQNSDGRRRNDEMTNVRISLGLQTIGFGSRLILSGNN